MTTHPLVLKIKASSVLINSKETDPVELRQFGDKYGEQGNGVDDEVDPVILCIETGQEIPVEGKDKDKIKSDSNMRRTDAEATEVAQPSTA